MSRKVIFSGIQPSGNLHIGNYIGALHQWSNMIKNEDNEYIFCIVDLHAITVPQDPKVLAQKNLELAALYIACGVDPEKAKIFIQSENPDHSYLAWIFDCILSMGQLFRMTQFKDKVLKRLNDRPTMNALDEARAEFDGPVGLFNYPALMAADILLYDTDLVPVGEDQKQHIELTRDIADRFNKSYGEIFKFPVPSFHSRGERIMSLQNPKSKMSKSDKDATGSIMLLDGPDVVAQKIKRAVTDSGSEISLDFIPSGSALENLLNIYKTLGEKSENDIKKLNGMSYGEFKKELTEVVNNKLSPIQKEFSKLMDDKSNLKDVLDKGRDFANAKSNQKIQAVKTAMGLGR